MNEFHFSDQSANDHGLAAFAGLRIIEVGSWLAVPNATAMFADLGAEVLKIESAGGDPVRRFPHSMRGDDVSSAAFAMLNRNKKSLVLNLGETEDRAQFETLLGTADVLVNNLRPAQIGRLGLDADALASRYPRLIVASLTGLGRMQTMAALTSALSGLGLASCHKSRRTEASLPP